MSHQPRGNHRLMVSCFEEMSQEDETGGLLLYDESLAGCGKR